jgi:DNA-binding NtrC family response regulator
MSSKPKVVCVFNTTPDIVELLRIVLEQAGFVVVSAYTWDLRESKVDINLLINQHNPDILIYDIAPPYEENWRLFQHFCGMPILKGMKFIVTTTNIRQVRAASGTDREMYEIVGKPYDLGLIVEAVKKAIGDPKAEQVT